MDFNTRADTYVNRQKTCTVSCLDWFNKNGMKQLNKVYSDAEYIHRAPDKKG